LKPLQQSDLNLIFRAASGFPYTPSGRDIGFVDKNSLRRPATGSLDAEIGRRIDLRAGFSLRLFAEVLNLTDRRNVLYVYPDTGDPDYTVVGDHSVEYMQDPSNYGSPRKFRLGMAVNF